MTVTHQGVRYWTTDELAASLIARDLISSEGTKREIRRRTRRWAEAEGVRAMATTRRGMLLWPEDATRYALGVDSLVGPG